QTPQKLIHPLPLLISRLEGVQLRTSLPESFSHHIVPKVETRQNFHPCQCKSTACALSVSSGINSSTATCVAARYTGGATPASQASFQRDAHKHQRSPGFRPGKPGPGVIRSLPAAFENSRNSRVILAQTTCTPTSSRPVLQQPSR